MLHKHVHGQPSTGTHDLAPGDEDAHAPSLGLSLLHRLPSIILTRLRALWALLHAKPELAAAVMGKKAGTHTQHLAKFWGSKKEC